VEVDIGRPVYIMSLFFSSLVLNYRFNNSLFTHYCSILLTALTPLSL